MAKLDEVNFPWLHYAEDDDQPIIIRKEHYIDEVEDKVRYWMANTEDLPRREKPVKHIDIPHFDTALERKTWEYEQIQRCLHGHDGMAGKEYFFVHFCYIKNLSGGKIRPDFRVIDNEWFKLVESCQRGSGWGIVCVKRRRVGASWKEACDVLHDAIFNPHYKIGMNSKTERDSIELFKKVKFLYNSLPAFLRVKVQSNTKMGLFFGYKSKDENGNPIMAGTQSEIMVVAPTDSAYEGQMLHKWVADEAGKTKNLDVMWSFTVDCLMQETRRYGVPILFGTSGDVGNDGKALREMWRNSEIYKLKRFFFAGWHGLITDECGNDLREEGIRYILYMRHAYAKLDPAKQNTFVQKYPLNTKEAFAQAAIGGVGNQLRISNHKLDLEENPAKVVEGFFQWNDGDPKWTPAPKGMCRMYEKPIPFLKRGYVAGCDPADHDYVFDEASDLSLYIMAKAHGTQPPRIVFSMTGRPEQLNDYYDQAIMALLYYNKCQVLIERNRFRMIAYMDENGYKYLLKGTPQGITRVIGGRPTTMGMNMTESGKEYLKGLITEYVDDYCESIPETELLQEFIEFGAVNTDRAMAFGMCLIHLKDDQTTAKRVEQINEQVPKFGFKRVGGKVVRYRK